MVETDTDRQALAGMVEKLERKGAEAAILGCTDLPLAISEENSSLPLIDTSLILENAAVRFLLDKEGE